MVLMVRREGPTTDLAAAQSVFTEAIVGSHCEQVWQARLYDGPRPCPPVSTPSCGHFLGNVGRPCDLLLSDRIWQR